MKTLVVARHQEDTSWYSGIPDGWTLLEVQKGRELPNEGREASSYLWAILRLYDGLADDDLVGFVQGDPFPHCMDIDLRLMLSRPVDGFLAIGEYNHVSGGDGLPAHQDLPVAEKYEEWLGSPFPGAVRFSPGAQFVVTGDRIRQHPKEFYRRLADDMGGLAPWVIERLWPTIFDRPRPLAATFYCQATPATTYLRCELPARYLPGKVSRECVLAQDDKDFWFPDHQGAAVFQFAGDYVWALTVHALQTKGVRVLVESDDNYFTVAPSMKRSGWVKRRGEGGHSLEGHQAIVQQADGCIVTTEQLARQYRKHNPNVYVCPNTVDPLDWPAVRKPDDGIVRVGWFASASHAQDQKLVRRAMEWCARQPNVQVVTMGLEPAEWRFPRGHIEFQELPGYRECLSLLDVAVAPVVATPWALCRSDVKALEYTMGGAAMVLSDAAPYSLWRDGETCLKASDPAGFLRQVRHLVQNPDEARQMAAEARRYVMAERTAAAQIDLWRQAVAD